MKMLWSVVLVSVLAALARGQTTDVSQCTSNGGELPIHTYIEGCTTPPCQLPQLQDAVINLVFRAPRTMRNMTTLATAYLLFVGISYDLKENAVTCNFLSNAYCPLLQGEVVQYTLKMYIEPTFPVGTSVTIEFRIVDEDSNPFVCIRVPVRIMSPVSGNNAFTNNSTAIINV